MKKDSLRPIPLNGLDKLFYSFELLGYPPIARILFKLRGGPIDIHLLQKAYVMEIERRPVLNATIDDNSSGSGWVVRWMPRDVIDPQVAVRLCDFSGISADTAEEKIREIQFDPFLNYSSRKDPPFSMVLCTLPDRQSRLLVFIHHAVSDAYGISMILGELFTLYNHLAAGHPIDDSECRVSNATPSSLLPDSRSERFIKLLGALFFLAWQSIKARGQSSAKIFYGKNTFLGTPACVQREVQSEQFSRYVAAAKRYGVSLNVFLVTAQIAAIDRWKRERGEPCGLISIEVHKNLRTANSDPQTLSNKFSTFFIYTRPRHRTDLKTLLLHVHREHEKAQKRAIAEKILCFLWLLDTRIGAKTLPLWGNFIFNNPRMGDTSQETNLGRLWVGRDNTMHITHLGDAEITELGMLGPPNPSGGNLLGFLTFNNRLYFMFNYFNWTMSDTEAQQFADLFEKTLEDLANCL